MSKTTLLAACVAIVASAGAAAEPFVRAVEPAAQRLAELRARLTADPRVQEAKAAVAAAEQAIAEKMSRDPAIADARRAEQAARKDIARAEQAAADASPRVQEHRRALEAAQARASELDLQRRVEEIKAEHLRNEARNRPGLRELWSTAHIHAHSPEAVKNDPRLAAARRKLDEANASLARKTRELAEHRAAEQARREFDEAVRSSATLKEAEAARRTLDEKLAADEKVAGQVAKLKTAAEAQATHRKKIEELEKKIRDAATEAAAKDTLVAEATKAAAEARNSVGRTIMERVAAEQKARDAALATWHRKHEAVVAENPEAQALMNEVRSLEERLQRLRSQMGELRKPVTQ